MSSTLEPFSVLGSDGHQGTTTQEIIVKPANLQSLRDLLQQSPNHVSIGIPHIVHHIWMQGAAHVPAKYDIYRASWFRHAPASAGFRHLLWDEAAILALITQAYPQWLSLYQRFTRLISRADVGRIFILHAFGGVYSDMDYRPLRDVAQFLEDGFDRTSRAAASCYGLRYVTLAGRMGKSMVNNAFIATTPQNRMWTERVLPLMDTMSTPASQPWWVRSVGAIAPDFKVARETGPYLWTRLLKSAELEPKSPSDQSGFDTYFFQPPDTEIMYTRSFHPFLLIYPEHVLYPLRTIPKTVAPALLESKLQHAVASAGAFGYHQWDNSWVKSSIIPSIALGRVSPLWLAAAAVVAIVLLVGLFLVLRGIIRWTSRSSRRTPQQSPQSSRPIRPTRPTRPSGPHQHHQTFYSDPSHQQQPSSLETWTVVDEGDSYPSAPPQQPSFHFRQRQHITPLQ